MGIAVVTLQSSYSDLALTGHCQAYNVLGSRCLEFYTSNASCSRGNTEPFPTKLSRHREVDIRNQVIKRDSSNIPRQVQSNISSKL